MKMMLPQVLELVSVQVILHKKEILILIVKVGCGTSGGSGGGGGTGKGTRGGGGAGGDYVSQAYLDMSWAQGDENYYATQDTDHGYGHKEIIWKD
ncbi:hypothetical protein AAG906_004883 [Vitis piasezkii]